MSPPMPLSRRTVLRGLAATIALPWLDAMRPARGAASLAGAGGAGPPPLRLVWSFIPNGVYAPDWRPNGEGETWTASPLLEPLQEVRRHVIVCSNFGHHNAQALGDGPGDHARSAACFLTGAHPRKTAGDDIEAGVSVDQVAAGAVGSASRFASLEVGVEPGMDSGNCDSGYSCAYSANISWRNPRTPNAKEASPRQFFERLFGNGEEGAVRAERMALRRSVLDLTRRDALRLATRLGRDDRRRVEEYLEGVRELERRVQDAERERPDPAAAGVEAPRSAPRDYREHLRLMNDLMVAALRIDATRVATFMYANEGSNRPYPFLGIRDGHHDVSHHGGQQEKIDKFRQINRFQVEEFARLVTQLAAVREGDGTLLDHTLVAFGGAICDGNKHDHHDLPIVLAGGAAAGIRGGRHLVAPQRTPLCNLWLAMLARAGVDRERFGDSTGVASL